MISASECRVIHKSRDVVIAGRVRIAGTSSSRRRGLLDCTSLGPDEGLWIAPCEAIHTFGMKIPIDSVFLDRHGQVRKLCANLPPARIAICWKANSVLELAAGSIAHHGLALGDCLEIEQVHADA
jgi:uncharacterized protein